MRAFLAVAAAAAALSALVSPATAAAAPETHAYLVRAPRAAPSSGAASPPTLSFSVARAVLHQRLAPSPRGAVALHALLPDLAAAAGLDAIAAFGRPVPAVFDRRAAADGAGQRVIFVEGLASGEAAVLAAALDGPAFSIGGSVAADENARFVAELAAAGVEDVVRVNVKSDRDAFDRLMMHIPELRRLAAAAITETMVVAFPDALPLPSSSLQLWIPPTDKAALVARRQAESVMSESDTPAHSQPDTGLSFSQHADAVPLLATAAPATPVPTCFASLDACSAATGNCSQHGQCRNRWGPEAGDDACWACHCLMSADGTQWGGDTCRKIDVSVPFWLLAGSSFVLVWTVAGAVGLLYSVGGEKLPGVLGAGVSRKN